MHLDVHVCPVFVCVGGGGTLIYIYIYIHEKIPQNIEIKRFWTPKNGLSLHMCENIRVPPPGNIWLNAFTLYYVSIIDHTGSLESLRTLVGSQRQLLRVEFYQFQNKSPYCSLASRRPAILCCVANRRTQVVGNFSWLYPAPLVFGENFYFSIYTSDVNTCA